MPIDAAALINNATGLTLLFVLLSLVAFWLSTQQSGLLIRLPIWIAGVGLLALAAFQAAQIGDLQKPLGDAVKAAQEGDAGDYKGQFGVIVQTLSANIATTKRYVAPLLVMMIAFGAILGVFSFLALTPGQFLERVFVRPLAIGLLGATIGAGLALVIVAISFGGPVDLKRYVGLGATELVHDGDTFWLGDVSVRLVGIDAPELAQTCWRGTAVTNCGTEARDHLAALVHDRIVSCAPLQNADGRTRESFGRPLVKCSIADAGPNAGRDLGELMVEGGYAAPYTYQNNAANPYAAQETMARTARAGLQATCMLRPDVWRDDKAAQFAFKSTGTIPTDLAQTFGDCANQPRVELIPPLE